MANRATGGAQSATPAVPVRYKHTFWWFVKWFFITLQVLVFCAIVFSAIVLKGVYDKLPEVIPDVRLLMERNRAEATRVYAADGSLLAEFKDDERKWVPLESLKRDTNRQGDPGGRLIDATLSVEDSRFYQHPGMDPKRIAGALVANFKGGGIEQGGSTITEQLAKLVFLNNSRTYSRRLNTALLALQLERKLSKDEILEAYLNEIFYGNRANGCEAAARRYFNKTARDLNIAEAALLAGIPQSPSRLEPFSHFDRAKKRQAIVLREMLEKKRINYAQYKEAVQDPRVEQDISRSKNRFERERKQVEKWRYPYFVSYVRSYVEKQYGYTDDFLTKAGLKIHTTLDPTLQNLSEKALYGQLNRLGRSGLEGAMVSIDPWTGQILTMVGGRNYYGKNGQWNRAAQGKRQVGSTMKPYIYSAAMEAGMTPETRIVDSPLYVCGTSECGRGSRKADRHEVRNHDRRHRGSMSLRQALGQSNNVVATRLLLKVGIQNAIQKAHLMGVNSSLEPYPSLALGVSDMTLLEHVSAYGVFATRGLRAESTPIVRIDSATGETLVQQPNPARGARVLSPTAADHMWKMLRYVVTNGTGRAASIRGVDVIGKTGTTSSNKDVWFLGSTNELVAGVWMGYDRPRELVGSTGGGWCAPVWRNYMVQAREIWRKRNPVKKLTEDTRATAQQRLIADQYKKVNHLKICEESGLLATANCPQIKNVAYSAAGAPPSQNCDIHNNFSGASLNLADGLSAPPPSQEPGDLGFDLNTDVVPVPENQADGPSSSESPVRSQSRREDSGRNPERGTGTTNSTGNAGTLLDDPGSAPPQAARPREDREVVATVCAETGELASSRCPVTVQQTFFASRAPGRSCRVHGR